MGITYECFFDVAPDPTLQCAQKGLEQLKSFGPDTIIALGGGSAMDAAKIMCSCTNIQNANLKTWLWTSWISGNVFTPSENGCKGHDGSDSYLFRYWF